MRKIFVMTMTALIGSLPLSPALADDNALIDQSVMISCGNSSGTGFYIDNTHIMTAKHVVTECKSATVISNSNKRTRASSFFLDPKRDIAVLTAENAIVKNVSTDSVETELGQTVFIVGSPIDGLVLSKGKVVESSGLTSPNRIYLEIPADHGNSGVPVFSNSGLIGMVTAKFDDGQVIAYDLNSLLRTLELSKKSPKAETSTSPATSTDNSTLPALQISLILNSIALITIIVLLTRLRKNKQITITLD